MMNHPGYHGAPHFQTNPDKYMVGLRHNIIYNIYIYISIGLNLMHAASRWEML